MTGGFDHVPKTNPTWFWGSVWSELQGSSSCLDSFGPSNPWQSHLDQMKRSLRYEYTVTPSRRTVMLLLPRDQFLARVDQQQHATSSGAVVFFPPIVPYRLQLHTIRFDASTRTQLHPDGPRPLFVANVVHHAMLQPDFS